MQPRPAPGIQFVGIPEFADLGTKVSQEISSAIAGKQSVAEALKKSRRLAQEVSDAYSGPLNRPGRRRPRPPYTPTGGPAARARRTGRAKDWARRAPLLPALVFLVVVTQLPFLATVVISFTRWNALAPDNRGFAAFDNYRPSSPTPRCAPRWARRCC